GVEGIALVGGRRRLDVRALRLHPRPASGRRPSPRARGPPDSAGRRATRRAASRAHASGATPAAVSGPARRGILVDGLHRSSTRAGEAHDQGRATQHGHGAELTVAFVLLAKRRPPIEDSGEAPPRTCRGISAGTEAARGSCGKSAERCNARALTCYEHGK